MFYCIECGEEMDEDYELCEECSFDPDWYDDSEFEE